MIKLGRRCTPPATFTERDNNTAMITLRNIAKIYRNGVIETHALKSVHLDIRSGEYISIQGPSGSGKSTLLAILGLLLRPSHGSFAFQETDIADISESKRAAIRLKHIGFVFQSASMDAAITIRENVASPLRLQGMGKTEAHDIADNLLQQVGLKTRGTHFPMQLSGGQLQRAAVARALVNDPKLLLADEPTGALDSSSAGTIIDLLEDANTRGRTVVIVTHDHSIAGRAKRIIHILDGSIVHDGDQQNRSPLLAHGVA